MSVSWEQLRVEARRLEGEVERSLSDFAKACAALSGSALGLVDASRRNDQVARELERVEALETRLQGCLRQLEEVNRQMTTFTQDEQGKPALLLVLQRHQEVLAESRIEYRRLRASLRQVREYFDLVGPRRVSSPERQRSQTKAGGGAGSLPGAAPDLERGLRNLESESTHVNGAHQAVDASLGQSMALRDELVRQRQTFALMFHRMTAMADSLPQVGRLVANIRRRKRRDVLVVATAAALLSLLTILLRLA